MSTTKQRKPLNIVENVIRVSLYKGKITFDHRIKAILPNCRKLQTCSFSPMTGYIWVKALYSYNGIARIHPERWRSVVNSAVVCSDTTPGFRIPAEQLTPEIIAQARKHAESIYDCSAIQNESEYKPDYDEVIGI
jgi:hypothetical protein